jgi:pyridoxal phosphate enzyme (YggS family)
VTLIGVTKTVPPEIIREAVGLGLTELGENRVQDARAKQQALLGVRAMHEPRSTIHGIRWHLVGHLQSNKAKPAVELFDVIHSVDSVSLIQALERQANTLAKSVEVFVQVNVSGETTKFGCRPDEVTALVDALRGCRQLTPAGLMTLAPFSEHPEEARPHFRKLRELRDALQTGRVAQSLHHAVTPSLQLSMGMSQDFEVAIEEGADVIRVGTAIFGERRT